MPALPLPNVTIAHQERRQILGVHLALRVLLVRQVLLAMLVMLGCFELLNKVLMLVLLVKLGNIKVNRGNLIVSHAFQGNTPL